MTRKTRLIKRYNNRKLYDTELSCYITLEEVAYYVKCNVNVKVMNNKDGMDVTDLIMLQAAHSIEVENFKRGLATYSGDVKDRIMTAFEARK